MPIRLSILTSRTIPHPEADAEQIVRTTAAMAMRGDVETTLVFATRWAHATDAASTIAREYGVTIDASRLCPCQARFDPPSVVRLLTRGRASGPQVLADAAVFRPVRELLRASSPHVVLTRRWPLAGAAARLGIPTIFETHSPRHAALLRRAGMATGWKGVVVHSECARTAFVSAGWSAEEVRVIRNGWDPPAGAGDGTQAAARARLGLPADARIVCYTGRLNARKDPGSLVQTAAAIPEALVLLVGACDGRETAALETMAAARGAGNVRVVPRVAPADVPTWLEASDVLIIAPSAAPLATGRTVLPLKTYAYLGAGRPVVGPATDDLAEVLVHGRNAWLVPPGNPAAAAAAIRMLLADAPLASRLAAHARVDAEAFTWTKRADRLVAFMHERCGELTRAGQSR